MTMLLTAIAAAFGALFLVLAGYVWLNRRQIASAGLLRERLGDLGTANAGIASAPILKQAETESRLDRYLAGRSFTAVVEEETRRSGIGWTPAQFASYVVAGVCIGSISAFWLPFAYALPFGVVGALAPFIMVARRRKQRERQIEEQLPDAVEMLVNSMKAGFSLQAGMNFVGTELPAPTGPEFARFYDEQRLGIDVKQALLSLQDRLGTLDARMLVLAILIQRETGGNLGEILGNISRVIRERINFRDHVGVLTAESKMSALILSLLPVLLFFIIQVTNPEYIAELTGTETGRLLLGYGAVSLVVGFLLLTRMSRIEA
jgi:tight adherence protein B